MQRVPSCAHCFKPYAFKGSGRPVGQRIPRLLSCGHTFCDGCIAKLTELHPRDLPCPTCEHPTALPGGKKQIKDLPTNLYILGILINNVRAAIEKDVTKGELSDFDLEKGFNFTATNSLFTADAPTNSKDSICEECCADVATSQCSKCEAIYCQPCFANVHSASRTLRSHEAVPLSLRYFSGFAEKGCSCHDGKKLEFYDKTNDELLCSLCVVSPQCQGHEIIPMSEMCLSMKEKIEADLEDVKKIHARLQQSRDKLSGLFPEVKAECGEVVQHIREHFQDLHTKLQAREVDLIREVKKAYCNESFLINTASEIVQQNKELEILIEQCTMALSSPSFIMTAGEELLSKLARGKDIPCILSKSSVQDLIKVSYSPDIHSTLQNYASVVSESSSLKLKKLSEDPEVSPPQNEESTTAGAERNESGEEAASPRYGGTIMNLPPRQNLVYVTHIKNPCDFMVQYAADGERLENLMEAVNHYCEGAKSLNDVVKSTEVGNMVCAQYSKDRNWYRARIVGKQQRQSAPKCHVQQLPKVEVCFIDYGNAEVVPLNRLRKIRPDFTDIPELAVSCSLVDIVPPTKNEIWPTQSIKAFGSLTREKALLMSVLKKSGGKLYVDLKSPDEEPTKDDDKPASVRDALVFLNVACFKSPLSVTNPKVAFPLRSYKKPIIPERGETMEVIVTYVENPATIYVMRETGKEYADTMRMISQMSSMYSAKKGNQWKIMWPYKGLICAARFSGDKVWYRALVTNVSADQSVRVAYVDFGNSEELPFSEIRRIPDHMMQVPMQAMRCSLAAVRPGDQQQGWSDDCIAFLSDTCILNRYRMKVIESERDQPMSVILYQQNGRQATSVNRLLLVNKLVTETDTVKLERLESESNGDAEEVTSFGDSSEIRDSSFSAEDIEGDSNCESAQKQILFPQKLMYKPVKLPTKGKFEFAITYVDKDCTILGYQLENGDQSLPELMKHVQKICTGDNAASVSQDQLSFNQPCCAEFTEDHLWYRAEVVDFPSQSTVLVDYIDFGNREEIPLASIKLNAPFLEIPKQCLPVQLDGLSCSCDEQGKVSKYLSKLLIGQTCVATMRKKTFQQGLLMPVSLTLTDGTDVLELTEQKVLMKHAKNNLKQQNPAEVQNIRVAPRKSAPAKSVVTDTFLPEKGVVFDVTVTQVDRPNVVFLQHIPPTEEDPGFGSDKDPTIHIANDHLIQLEAISRKINSPSYFESKPDITNVWEMMLCCGRYTQDDLWYRGQIMEIKSADPLQVEVLYIDYGTSEVIGLERLKPFPSDLLSLPKQAFRCSIAGLQGSTNIDSDVDRDSAMKAVDTLIKAVAGKRLVCKVVDFGSPITVELFERVCHEESYKDIPLHERMSELELIMDMTDEDSNECNEEGIEKAENGQELEKKLDCSEYSTKDLHCEEMALGDGECGYETKMVKKSGQDPKVLQSQLITPAQFCLKKDTAVLPDEKEYY